LLISDYSGGDCNEIGFHNGFRLSNRHQRRTGFGAHRRLTFLLRTSGFEDSLLFAQKTNSATRLIALAEESCNNVKVSTITEIQEAIDKLPAKERTALAAWLRSQDQPRMSEREEAALLASLDKAATELDAGRGVAVERVREMVGRWLTK
jgi:hypothetical protein